MPIDVLRVRFHIAIYYGGQRLQAYLVNIPQVQSKIRLGRWCLFTCLTIVVWVVNIRLQIQVFDGKVSALLDEVDWFAMLPYRLKTILFFFAEAATVIKVFILLSGAMLYICIEFIVCLWGPDCAFIPIFARQSLAFAESSCLIWSASLAVLSWELLLPCPVASVPTCIEASFKPFGFWSSCFTVSREHIADFLYVLL